MIFLCLAINFVLFFVIVDLSNRIRELELEAREENGKSR